MIARGRGRIAVEGGLILLSTLAGLALWPDLPAEVAIHFSASGTPDNYVPRLVGVVLLPAIMAGTLAVMHGVGSFQTPNDPRTLAVTSIGTIGLLAVLHVLVLAWNAGYGVPLDLLVPGAVVWALGLAGYALARGRALGS